MLVFPSSHNHLELKSRVFASCPCSFTPSDILSYRLATFLQPPKVAQTSLQENFGGRYWTRTSNRVLSRLRFKRV